MDRGGSDLSSSLPEPEKPCLIVEDSQPDSGALDDDPDSSYRTLLALRLSSLQPSPHSPVLEVISSPAGNRCSQTDNQSEQPGSGIEGSFISAPQEESQVIPVCPALRSNPYAASRCASENMVMEPGAGSSTHCPKSEGVASQLGVLELSESQALGGELGKSEEVVTDRQHSQPAEMKASAGTAARQDSNTKRSEASPSKQWEPQDQASSGSQDQASRGSQGQASKGSQDQASRGSQGQASKGSQDQASRGSQGQASKGSQDQAIRGSQGQASKGSQDQASRGSQGHAISGSQGQASKGSQDQASRGSQGQASKGSQDQASSGSQDQASSGSQDQASRVSQGQASSRSQDQASSGSQGQVGRESQGQAGRESQGQASRGSQDQASRGSQGQASRELSVQALLHSQQDSELLSSQEDLFDHDRAGSVLDNQGVPTATPAHTLRLLQLSGHGTLVEQSLSQSSVDYVAPTQDPLSQTPLIVANSPTGTQHLHADQSGEKEKEPLETDAVLKPRPSASTPVSQNSPGFVLERSLSVPSQPEFSHDVFVPTQSQDGPHDPLSSSSVNQKQVPSSGSRPIPLQQSCSLSLQAPEDSQDTQIEGLEEPLGLDTSDSMTSGQRSQSNAASSQLTTTAVVLPTNPNHNPPLPGATGTEGHSSWQNRTAPTGHVQEMNVSHGAAETKARSSAKIASCSQPKSDTPSHSVPCSQTSLSLSVISQKSGAGSARAVANDSASRPGESDISRSLEKQGSSAPPGHGAAAASQSDPGLMNHGEEMEEEEEDQLEESTVGPESCVLGLALSQSQVLSPGGAMEEEERGEESSDVIVLDETQRSERSSQLLEKGTWSQSKRSSSQPIESKVPVSTNGHGSQSQPEAPDRLSQSDRGGPEAEGIKDKSLSDSSSEIPFHFTLPKGSQLIGPAISTTPPLINQLKQTPRHSTPIEITSFSEKSAVTGDVSTETAMATSDITAGESGEDTVERPDGKLSLRMKLVTPVEEGSSERFSLQKPTLSDEESSVVKVTTATKAITSPSVFSRVRQAHRQMEDGQASPTTPGRGHLFSSPQSSLGSNSLPNSQSELSSQGPNQEVLATPLENPGEPLTAGPESRSAAGEGEEPGGPGPAKRTAGSQQTSLHSTNHTPPKKLCQMTVSQQTSFEAPLPPSGRGEPETPPRISGPAHRRHVRTIQEVRTTITRIITDVYYEDGKEVDRKVSQESEGPVVEVQDSDISPCRTGSSLTPGDLGDISSLSSKASSSSTGPARPDFIMPPSRGAKPSSPRRGGGQQQRGHRGQRAGSHVVKDRRDGAMGAQALSPQTPRGRARRGRPPSHSSPGRGGGAVGVHQAPPLSSSEEERSPRLAPPRLPDSPSQTSHSDSLRSSPEAAGSATSSFVGLRVVAKWSSNGYFYSGRITREEGEGRFRLRFDDGYECEVAGKDILLCDPIPMETEVTALLDDQFFSIGTVKGHKTEKQDVFYSVEREGQCQWFRRSAVILSLEQGNRLREQYSLGPYEPATPLAKAADISLDNLVEGKRKRRGGPGTPNRSSSDSPRTPGPSGKRKLIGSEEERTPAKRGRRGAGPRAAQRAGVVNTSGSGTDLPGQSADPADTHGPLPQNTALFLGFAFMLTASSEIDQQTNKPISDGEEEYVQTAPYNRSYTEEQLQAGGGFVLPDFNQEQCKAAYQSLLIADQHCRTRKYLLCVASGVPCVSHMWVRDCCKENKLLNYRNYLLPAGVGPDQSIVEWHPSCSPLASLRVLLVFEPAVELWSQLATLSGAASVRQYQADKDTPDIPAGRFDLVVTDRACPPLVLQSVTSQKVPLVSPEWLIHSIIRGECLGYHSNPEYRHDYCSE